MSGRANFRYQIAEVCKNRWKWFAYDEHLVARSIKKFETKEDALSDMLYITCNMSDDLDCGGMDEENIKFYKLGEKNE